MLESVQAKVAELLKKELSEIGIEKFGIKPNASSVPSRDDEPPVVKPIISMYPPRFGEVI